MPDRTIDAVFIELVCQGRLAAKLDYRNLLLRHNIEGLTLNKDQPRRIPLTRFAAFTLDIMKISNDEFLGLGQAPQPLGSFHMMCRSTISAHTIIRSLKRTAKFWNLFQNTYQHKVIQTHGITCYRLTEIADQTAVNHYVSQALLSSIHRYHIWLAGQFLPLQQVDMNIAKPTWADEYHPLYYGAPIVYAQACNQLCFADKHIDLDIVQTADKLDAYLSESNLSLLNQPRNYRVLSEQLRLWLEKNIAQGNYRCSLQQAARHFQISQQVLHRRLQQEQISFKEIKMQVRRDIATKLLFQGSTKIEDIALQVGFSEPSAFIRAFKSWTGVTPLQYRQSQTHNRETILIGN